MTSLDQLIDSVRHAAEAGQPLDLCGNGSKANLGYPAASSHQRLELSGYTGVLDYRPDELMVRACCGTTIAELNAVLSAQGQMLGFEPPDFEGRATLGGTLAAAASGSRRPFTGSVRDFVLGTGLILSTGSYLEFGGQVMKNVAGYDVSRLMCGAFGVLGVVADVSLRVLPRPAVEVTRVLELDESQAREKYLDWQRVHRVMSGCCYMAGQLYLRLSGSSVAVESALASIGGEEGDHDLWSGLNAQDLPVLSQAGDLWRLATQPLEPCSHDFAVMDWGFSQRWLVDPDEDPRGRYRGQGHWTRYRRSPDCFDADPFEPLAEPAMALHRQLKQAFDPCGIFNPGRMYREF